jgi:UDP-N-acetylmuramate--alanine ligase
MNTQKIYIIGVGGIGLSALAQLYIHEGAVVLGSDRSDSPTTELLRSKGIKVFVGQSAEQVPEDASFVVYSDAVAPENPERARARELGIPEMSYFEAAGKVTQGKKVVAVSGAHGKTTTTAMLIDIFEAAGLDPTAIVGSIRAKTKSNFRAGNGEYFIVEADEFRRHFLNFSPYILVITNIDADHLDYYKDLADIQSAFQELVHKVPQNGFVVCDVSDKKVASVVAGAKATVVDYKKYFSPHLPLKVLSLNQVNAAAALAVAVVSKIDTAVATEALSNFAGTWRRFEFKGETKNGALVYDDYAHHPNEIAATIKSVRQQFPGKKIIVAFHPHLYSRTKLLLDDFVDALSLADRAVIAPIFAAREAPDPSVSSEILVQRIRAVGGTANAVGSLKEVTDFIKNEAGQDDIVLTMGAGDIYKAGEAALETK